MGEELKTIFNNFKVKNKSVPVAHLRYIGKSKTYVVWTLLDEDPALYGGDECLYSICSVDIDIYSDSNYLDIMEEIKKIMKNNGWIWIGDSEEMYEDDTELYHRTCSFQKERMI